MKQNSPRLLIMAMPRHKTSSMTKQHADWKFSVAHSSGNYAVLSNVL